MDDPPVCESCGHVLDRIDHIGIQRFILDNDVYRDLGIEDGDGGPGIASEVHLRCGHCQTIIKSRGIKAFFYERWIRLYETHWRPPTQ